MKAEGELYWVTKLELIHLHFHMHEPWCMAQHCSPCNFSIDQIGLYVDSSQLGQLLGKVSTTFMLNHTLAQANKHHFYWLTVKDYTSSVGSPHIHASL